MDLMRPVRAFDVLQQRRKGLAIPIAVLKKFGNDQASNLAALIAYFGFFSLFPLLLVFTTILGFVLRNNPSAQHSSSSRSWVGFRSSGTPFICTPSPGPCPPSCSGS